MRHYNEKRVLIGKALERTLGTQWIMKALFRLHPAGEVKRILVLEPFLIGDFLMAIPAFRLLRQRFPEARIDCVAPPVMAGLEAFFPWVDELIPFRCPWSPGYRDWSVGNLRQAWKLMWTLRRKRYDWGF